MNVSLPESLKVYVDDRVDSGGYGTSSEYIRELIRRDKDRNQLRAVLLEGAESGAGTTVDEAYFQALRDRIARS